MGNQITYDSHVTEIKKQHDTSPELLCKRCVKVTNVQYKITYSSLRMRDYYYCDQCKSSYVLDDFGQPLVCILVLIYIFH